jgi:aspartate racemase
MLWATVNATKGEQKMRLNHSLGVLGGMGPLATVDFLKKLTVATEARCDQQHVPLLVYSDCTTPDRTQSILRDGPSPLPQMLAGIEFLNRAGCVVIAVPCNSAHYWYDDMAGASRVPVLNIVRASAERVRCNNPKTCRIGVLSTEGTNEMRIYRQTLEQLGFEVITPTPDEFHEFVSPGISDVKRNEIDQAEKKFDVVADRLQARGAEQIILGCTEIPVGMQARCAREPNAIVDSNAALAEAVLAFFGRARRVAA